MKKNLLSIIILALLIVNIVLTSIMMFSVTGAAQKTASLVTEVMNTVKMEKGEMVVGKETGAPPKEVALQNTVPYDIKDPMTVPLKLGEDGKQHFAIVEISLSQDNKNKEFKTYGGEKLENTVGMIQDVVINVFGRYTLSEIRNDQTTLETIKQVMLEEVQAIYNSDFIFRISFKDIQYQ